MRSASIKKNGTTSHTSYTSYTHILHIVDLKQMHKHYKRLIDVMNLFYECVYKTNNKTIKSYLVDMLK